MGVLEEVGAGGLLRLLLSWRLFISFFCLMDSARESTFLFLAIRCSIDRLLVGLR